MPYFCLWFFRIFFVLSSFSGWIKTVLHVSSESYARLDFFPLLNQIMRDPDTGNSRGFGFISYDSFEASDAAIEVRHFCLLASLQPSNITQHSLLIYYV